MDSVLPLVTAAQAVLIPVIIVSCLAIPSTSWHDLTPLYSTQISHWNLLPDHIMVKDRYPMNIRNEKVMILPLLMVFFPELEAFLGWLNHKGQSIPCGKI